MVPGLVPGLVVQHTRCTSLGTCLAVQARCILLGEYLDRILLVRYNRNKLQVCMAQESVLVLAQGEMSAMESALVSAPELALPLARESAPVLVQPSVRRSVRRSARRLASWSERVLGLESVPALVQALVLQWAQRTHRT